MDEKYKDTEFEGMMAQEPSLAEMPLTELKEVDYTVTPVRITSW